MQVSREYAIRELITTIDALTAWRAELEQPAALDKTGTEVPFYPDGVPSGLSVDDVEGVPAAQFRAELLAIAGKLEALASF
jgi:hypothetical protein